MQLLHSVLEEKKESLLLHYEKKNLSIQYHYLIFIVEGKKKRVFLDLKGANNIPSGQFLHLHFMTIFLFVNWKQRGNSTEKAPMYKK